MKTLLLLLFTTATLLGQGGSYCSYMTGDPRLYANKFGLVAYYGLFDTNSITLNGAGESKVIDKSWKPGRLENLLVQSQDFSTSWAHPAINNFGAGSVVDSTNAPDGTLTGDFVQENTGAAASHYMTQTSSTLTPGTYVYGVSIMPGGRNWSIVYCEDNANPANQAGRFFDLTNNVAGVTSYSGGTFSLLGSSVTAQPNGWYLYSITFSISARCEVKAQIYLGTGDGTAVYAGDNTSGLFLWGAQLRRSTSSSTYYATTTVVEDASRDLLQGTAANQPLVSRSDNKGNLLVQSETFSTTWARTRINAFGATDTGATGAGSFANTTRTTDPLGGNTADFIQEDGTAGATHVIQLFGSSGVNVQAGTYSLACYVKPAGRTWIRIYIDDHTDILTCYFNLAGAGTVGTAAATGTSTIGTCTITTNGIGDGTWYLCTLNGTLAHTGLFDCRFGPASGDGGVSYDGDNTSGLFLWGASLRQSTWDSDYIATTSTIAVPGLNGKTTAYFDGANHYLKTAAFTLNQPTTCIWVGKQVTWAITRSIWDGNASASVLLFQSSGSPSMRNYYGIESTDNTGLALGTWGVVSSIANGANSSIQVNNKTAVTGDFGANNAGGFTLGARGGGTLPANIYTSQVLLFNRALAANELAAIWKWAQGIGGTALAF